MTLSTILTATHVQICQWKKGDIYCETKEDIMLECAQLISQVFILAKYFSACVACTCCYGKDKFST